MHIERIATRSIERLEHRPGDVTLTHPYRRRWWLPIIGPTATVLLDHLTEHTSTDWQIHDTAELTTYLGLGHSKPSGLHSRLIRTFDRLTHFGFATFDIEPGHPDIDPCITLWTTIGLAPERITRNWPPTIQHAHAIDLARPHRAAA